jgi:hypothetical protein
MEKQLLKEGHGFGRAEQPPTQSGHDASPVRASPGLLVRGAGFQTRENALSLKNRALALVRMTSPVRFS